VDGTHERLSGQHGLGRGNRQALASLGPSALEHEAPVFGAHTHQKSMGPGPALSVWLERTLHDVRSPGAVE
jgi:hypothetical protein